MMTTSALPAQSINSSSPSNTYHAVPGQHGLHALYHSSSWHHTGQQQQQQQQQQSLPTSPGSGDGVSGGGRRRNTTELVLHPPGMGGWNWEPLLAGDGKQHRVRTSGLASAAGGESAGLDKAVALASEAAAGGGGVSLGRSLAAAAAVPTAASAEDTRRAGKGQALSPAIAAASRKVVVAASPSAAEVLAGQGCRSPSRGGTAAAFYKGSREQHEEAVGSTATAVAAVAAAAAAQGAREVQRQEEVLEDGALPGDVQKLINALRRATGELPDTQSQQEPLQNTHPAAAAAAAEKGHCSENQVSPLPAAASGSHGGAGAGVVEAGAATAPGDIQVLLDALQKLGGGMPSIGVPLSSLPAPDAGAAGGASVSGWQGHRVGINGDSTSGVAGVAALATGGISQVQLVGRSSSNTGNGSSSGRGSGDSGDGIRSCGNGSLPFGEGSEDGDQQVQQLLAVLRSVTGDTSDTGDKAPAAGDRGGDSYPCPRGTGHKSCSGSGSEEGEVGQLIAALRRVTVDKAPAAGAGGEGNSACLGGEWMGGRGAGSAENWGVGQVATALRMATRDKPAAADAAVASIDGYPCRAGDGVDGVGGSRCKGGGGEQGDPEGVGAAGELQDLLARLQQATRKGEEGAVGSGNGGCDPTGGYGTVLTVVQGEGKGSDEKQQQQQLEWQRHSGKWQRQQESQQREGDMSGMWGNRKVEVLIDALQRATEGVVDGGQDELGVGNIGEVQQEGHAPGVTRPAAAVAEGEAGTLLSMGRTTAPPAAAAAAATPAKTDCTLPAGSCASPKPYYAATAAVHAEGAAVVNDSRAEDGLVIAADLVIPESLQSSCDGGMSSRQWSRKGETAALAAGGGLQESGVVQPSCSAAPEQHWEQQLPQQEQKQQPQDHQKQQPQHHQQQQQQLPQDGAGATSPSPAHTSIPQANGYDHGTFQPPQCSAPSSSSSEAASSSSSNQQELLCFDKAVALLDPDLPAATAKELQVLLAAAGVQLAARGHLGAGVTLVVCEPRHAGRWLHLMVDVVSPQWLTRYCKQQRQKQQQRVTEGDSINHQQQQQQQMQEGVGVKGQGQLQKLVRLSPDVCRALGSALGPGSTGTITGLENAQASVTQHCNTTAAAVAAGEGVCSMSTSLEEEGGGAGVLEGSSNGSNMGTVVSEPLAAAGKSRRGGSRAGPVLRPAAILQDMMWSVLEHPR